VRDELQRSGFMELIAAGIVLTGGSSRMEGATELAEEIFHMPVRSGIPQHVSGMADVVRNPIYATGVGLLLLAQQQRTSSSKEPSVDGSGQRVWQRMRQWFSGKF